MVIEQFQRCPVWIYDLRPKSITNQIISFPQMPRKLYGLKEIKQIAGSWGAISSGNVSRSKEANKLAGAMKLPAVGGWVFPEKKDVTTFENEHGTVGTNDVEYPYGPLAFYGWRECSWKARAFYLQLMSFRAFDHNKFTLKEISERSTNEAILMRKFVSRIDSLLAMESNQDIAERVSYLNQQGEFSHRLQISGNQQTIAKGVNP